MKQAVTRAWEAVGIYIQALSFLLALFCIFNIAPPNANAATKLNDTQIQAITNLVASFGASQEVIKNVEMALRDVPQPRDNDEVQKHFASSTANMPGKNLLPPTASACAVLARTLKRGSVGEEVTKLQEFLRQSGDFEEASTTDYFGPATERALKAWQARMDIATSGDAESTGFGALGPKTRELMARMCQQQHGAMNNTQTQNAQGSSAPTCVLRADQSAVAAHTPVILRWEGKNATYAGSASGEKMPPSGSITVTPVQTTLYIKHVYGPGGEGSCQTMVTVSGDSSNTPSRQIVFNMGNYLSSLLGSMQLGAVVVAEVFGLQSQ